MVSPVIDQADQRRLVTLVLRFPESLVETEDQAGQVGIDPGRLVLVVLVKSH